MTLQPCATSSVNSTAKVSTPRPSRLQSATFPSLAGAMAENHTEFATAIAWLGYILVAQGRHAEAEPLYKRSLAIVEQALGSGHRSIGSILNNLAAPYESQGRYAEAEPLYRRAP